MKTIFLIILFFQGTNLLSQNLEFYGGANQNTYYDKVNDSYMKSYSKGYGIDAGIAVSNIRIVRLNFRFALSFDTYSGELYVYHHALGGGSKIFAKTRKSIIALGIYPANFRILNRINLNLGFEIARLVDEKFSGTYSSWTHYKPYSTVDLNERFDRLGLLTTFGLRGRIAYTLFPEENVMLTPQYGFYYGLSKEFEYPKESKSVRHYIGLGIVFKL
jgi:hypothetical protein